MRGVAARARDRRARIANLYASVGVHPDYADTTEPTVGDARRARRASRRSSRSARPGSTITGSTGDLDGSASAFARTSARRATRGKPLVIHTRSAAADTLAIMREERADEVGGVMHCFTETWDVAQRALDLGFHISFSGIVTFKNAVELKDVARRVPLERMLIETDSPYLAPVPYRGKRNQPAWVPARRARRSRGCAKCRSTAIAAATSDNFFRLFGVEPQCALIARCAARRCSSRSLAGVADRRARAGTARRPDRSRSPTTAPTTSRRLLARGVDPECRRRERRSAALHRGARGRARASVDVLLAAKAKSNRANRFGDTPLMVAALDGHLDVVRKLRRAAARRSIRRAGRR